MIVCSRGRFGCLDGIGSGGSADVKLNQELQTPSMSCGERTRNTVVVGSVGWLHVFQLDAVIGRRLLRFYRGRHEQR